MTMIVPLPLDGFKHVANKCQANALRSMRIEPDFGLKIKAFRTAERPHQQRKTSSDGTSGDQED
ncbi:hypothetical protein GR212_27030 [Rhizobium lusitanum]|uniref:Uncharacterized protein n=1 Tax=Rhizobium lusitanum TaxID=293958 RepID=A0A6L9UC88_9HYPH|nr:hypothetical protein [Rhizobium lusitanum]NEI73214.1 hypothetical protein [Rhizobium lusitanum]